MSRFTIISILLVMSFCPLALAEAYRLDLAHTDVDAPLTVGLSMSQTLGDGCVGQVIEDVANDGVAPPKANGEPGVGDQLLGAQLKGDKGGLASTFAVNGNAVLNAPGLFILEPGISGDVCPDHSIFMRVWNSPDAASATGYWDSPVYEVLAGPQQVSFLRDEWTYHRFSSATAGLQDLDALLANPALLSAYPNPFNAATRIALNLEHAQTVELKVFDLQGRLVHTLVDGHVNAGRQTYAFDASTLPSGLYFLSLRLGGEFKVAQKLLLVR